MSERKTAAVKKREVIRIDPSQLVIEKSAGKKTANSIFCLRRSSPTTTSTSRQPSTSLNAFPTKFKDPQPAPSYMSGIVSDISDLSVMSYFATSRLFDPSSLRTKRSGVDSLPEVHESPGRRNVTKPRRFEFSYQQFNKVSSLQSQSENLKEHNFVLNKRENLKSRIAELGDSARPISVNLPSHDHEKELEKIRDRCSKKEEELTKLKEELSSIETVVTRERSQNESFRMRCKDLETDLKNAIASKVSAEHNLSVVMSERNGLTESRNWYRDQLKLSQDARSEARLTVINLQKEALTKDGLLEQWKTWCNHAKNDLEEERKTFLKEKTDLLRQLEDLEVEIAGHNNAESTSSTLSTLEEENLKLKTEFKGFHDAVEKLQLKIRESDDKVRKISGEREDLSKKYLEMTSRLEDSQISLESQTTKLEEIQSKLDIALGELKEKETLLEGMKNSKMELEVLVAGLKAEKMTLDTTIRKVKEDFARLTENFSIMKSDLIDKDQQIEDLKRERNLLKAENQRCQEEFSQVSSVRDENLELKTQLSTLESFQKQNVELLQENESLQVTNNILQSKINVDEERGLTRQKHDEYSADLSRRDEIIRELKERIASLESSVTSEPEDDFEPDSTRILHLYLNEIDSLKEKLSERELNESELREQLSSFELEEKDYANEIIILRKELEKIIRENVELKTRMENEVIADDEFKGLQSLKIARLENHISEYERDVESLTGKLKEMESDILYLERVNGTLSTENLQIEDLKNRISGMKIEYSDSISVLEDSVRRLSSQNEEMLRDIEHYETTQRGLKDRLSSSETELLSEKKESAMLRDEIRSLKIGLETSNLTIERIKKESYSETEIESFKRDLQSQKETIEVVLAEKRRYQSQVREMNVALRSCLLHLKSLRTAAGNNNSIPMSTSSSPLPPYEESSIQELLQKCSRPSNIGRNLRHLQNCLSTLKSEMAILQEKLNHTAYSQDIGAVTRSEIVSSNHE